jgi:hypothetical protein
MKYLFIAIGLTALISCKKETIAPEQCQSLKGIVSQTKVDNEWVTTSVDTLGTTYCSDTTIWFYASENKRIARKGIN